MSTQREKVNSLSSLSHLILFWVAKWITISTNRWEQCLIHKNIDRDSYSTLTKKRGIVSYLILFSIKITFIVKFDSFLTARSATKNILKNEHILSRNRIAEVPSAITSVALRHFKHFRYSFIVKIVWVALIISSAIFAAFCTAEYFLKIFQFNFVDDHDLQRWLLMHKNVELKVYSVFYGVF